MSTTTTESWRPQTCPCFIQYKFEEGPDVVGDAVQSYCSIAEATLIRQEKHERFLAQYRTSGDQLALEGRLRWWNRQGPYEQTICPGHSGLTADLLYSTLRDESARQNITLNIIRVGYPNIVDKDIVFTFTGADTNRVLHVSFGTPIAGLDRVGIQGDADLQFGPGKVLVA